MKAIIFTDVAGYPGFGRSAGAYRIASEFRKRGDEVKVIDCFNSYTLEQLKAIIVNCRTSETQWIGFSTTFLIDHENSNLWNKDKSHVRNTAEINDNRDEQTSTALSIIDELDLFNFIKSLGLKIVLGGWRGWRTNLTIKNDPDIIIYHGPCEERFFSDFDFTKSQILFNDDDHILEEEDLPIEISRGCIFKCKFCHFHLNGKKLWDFVKPPELIREEMMQNYINFGTTGYMFSDDTYNDSPVKIEELLKMYRTLPFDLRFSTYARLDLMISHKHTQEMLVESGMKSVFFGIETLNQEAGKFVGKGMDPEKVKRGLLEFREKYPDVFVYVSMIGGLPGETLDDMQESFEFLTKEAKVNQLTFGPLFINSGSDMSLNAEKYGYKKDANHSRSWTRKDGLTFLDVYEWCAQKKREYPGSPVGFTMYNRLRNVGYSEDELLKLSFEKNVDDIMDRTKKFRENYMNKIL